MSKISETEDSVFSGRLAIWTQVDVNSDVIYLRSFEQKPLSESEVDIPQNIGLNSKIFAFAFNEKSHRLYIEILNDENKSLSPKRAELAIYRILSQLNFTFIEEINVHVVPKIDSVDRILELPNLNKIEMRIHRPNPDTLGEAARNVLKELEDQGAKSQDVTLTKAPGFDELTLNAKNKLLAAIAALNGYVKGKGKADDGKVLSASTKDTPLTKDHLASDDTTSSGQVRYVAKQE